MAAKAEILFLSDNPNSSVAADLDILYPGRVKRTDFRSEAHGPEVLQSFGCVVTMVHDGRNLGSLDYGAVTDFARQGGKVISCLFEYARNRELHFSKTHVGNRVVPAMRIEVETKATRGYSLGDEVWWFGTVSSAPDTIYSNQMLQRQIMDAAESDAVQILATSTLNGGAVMILERVGSGEILALDLLSPIRPFYDSKGSTNKYLFLANFLTGAVRYGKHYPKRLSYDEFAGAMARLADRHSQLRLIDEGPCSDGRPLWSFELGEASSPTVYFGAAIHGWEWENAFGLLRLAEVLCESPNVEGLDTSRLCFKLVPIQNPYGYDHFIRQNARGVDLNRNFDFAWEELPVVQDVVVPWDYNYKGARAASERETQIIQRIIDERRPRCVIDFHTADYVMMLPHKGDKELLDAVHEDIKARMRDRFICQRPYGGPYQQANMERMTDFSQPQPYFINYAAEAGVPAAFLIEMSGNRTDVHALVMNTDAVVEICLAAVGNILQRM